MVGDSDMEDEGERVEFTKLGDNLEEPADVRNPESDIVQNVREITGAEERAFLARYVRIVSLKKTAWRMCTRPHTSYRCFPSQIRELRGDYPGDSINSDILGIVLKISDNPRDQ